MKEMRLRRIRPFSQFLARYWGGCSPMALAVVALTLTAAQTGIAVPDGKTYIDASVKDSYRATDSDGSEITVTNGADVVVVAMFNGNCAFAPQGKSYSSLTFAAERRKNFWTDSHFVSVGAGGISFLTNSVFSTGRSTESSRNLTITADQTWSGLDFEMEERPVLSVGHPFFGSYYKMGLGVADGVHALTVEKLLDVWFTGQNAALGEVDLTVKAPACLHLAKERKVNGVTSDLDAHLSARSLTLVGDGDALALGQPLAARWSGESAGTCASLDAIHYAPVLHLRDGADVTAVSPCVFAIPSVTVSGAASDTSAWTGAFAVTQALTSVALSDGVALDLTAATMTEDGVAASLAFTGTGTVRIAPATYSLTGTLSFGERVKLVFEGPGDLGALALSGAGDIEFDPGADGEILTGDFSDTTGSLTLKSGRAVLVGGRGSLSSVAAEDGAAFVEGGGFVVTDTIRPEAELTIRVGETLKVYGSGLTAQTRLTLDGGTLAFYRSATVAAPVFVRQSSVIGADASVTGEISGAVNCAITNGVGLVVKGLGCHVFSGGFTSELPDGDWRSLTKTNCFFAFGGDVILKTGQYFFGNGLLRVGIEDTAWNVEKQGLPPYCCRRLTVGDGADVSFAEWPNSQGAMNVNVQIGAPIDPANYQQNVTLEIAAGGSLTVSRNHQLRAGNNQSRATVELTGGSLTMNADAIFYLGSGGYVTGDLVLRGGTLTLTTPLRPYEDTDVARVLWQGGTLRLAPSFPASKPILAGRQKVSTMPTLLKSSCQILGDGCVLDLGAVAGASVTNTPTGFDRGEWIGTGTLTVRGGDTCREFVMNAFPSGIGLRLENDVQVTIPQTARVYDPEKSRYDWVRPYPQSNFTSTDGWLMPENELSLAEFGPGSKGVALVAESPDMALAVGTIRVPPGGWWNNAAPFFASLASWSFTNLVFEPGAEWNVTRDSTGENSLRVTGSLTLPTMPDTLVVSRSSRVQTGDRTLARAEGSVSGDPAIVKNGPFYYSFEVDAAGRCVRLGCKGTVLVIR